MSDKSAIEWTDATPVIDRGGRRIRFYLRKTTNRPGTQERRLRAAQGLKWCSGCKAWLSRAAVGHGGKCQPCTNRYLRELYATNPAFREARKAHRDRRRGVERVPPHARELLSELFEGECAYCPAQATTWDHVLPVTKGGTTVPGNILPACASCNSSKGNRDLAAWLDQTHSIKAFTVEYLTDCGTLDV